MPTSYFLRTTKFLAAIGMAGTLTKESLMKRRSECADIGMTHIAKAYVLSVKLMQHTLVLAVLLIWINVCAAPDFRVSPESKLQAAKKHIQNILDEDAKPQRGFYGRKPTFPVWKDQALLDCASYMIVRAIEAKEPYFEDKRNRVVVVPVWAELLIIYASQSGGPRAAMDGSLPSQCAFEYERWSFTTKRFEKIQGFRTRTHYDEFSFWGESVVNNRINRWVAIDLDKRYVRFLTRVSVVRDAPYQLAPQFPVHYPATHSLNLLNFYLKNAKESVEKRISLRDSRASGDELERDMVSTKKQIINDSWAIDHLLNSLQQLQTLKPFEEIQP